MKKIFALLSHGENELPSSSTSSLTNHNDLHTGKQFTIGNHRFTVESVIAEGGFGVVCKVQTPSGLPFALKRTLVNNETDLANMKREITIVSSLSHKNILNYIDSKITQKAQGIYEVLLVTSFYPGSVAQVLQERRAKNQRFLEAEVLRILCDLCEAISRLHHCQTPIIHRDLKIENILIDARTNFILCDFGSATSRVLHPGTHGPLRCQEEIEKYTTLAYRAPEMVDLYSGGGTSIGTPVDIWALGCILFGLCFFSLPFGSSPLTIQSGIFSVPDNSLYSQHLHKLIKYLLTVDITKRPDIFQVSALAFSLQGRPNPVQNVNSSIVSNWHSLSLPPTKTELNAVTSTRQRGCQPSSTANRSPTPAAKDEKTPSSSPRTKMTTSIIARSRPRASNLTSASASSVFAGLKPPSSSSPASYRPESQAHPVCQQLTNTSVSNSKMPDANLEPCNMATDIGKPPACLPRRPPNTLPIQESHKGHRRGLSEATAISTDSFQVRQTHSLTCLIEPRSSANSIIPPDKTWEQTDFAAQSCGVRTALSTDLDGIDFNAERRNKQQGDLDNDLFGAAFDAIRGQTLTNTNANHN